MVKPTDTAPSCLLGLDESALWRPIPGYEGLYEASWDGRIQSLPRATTTGGILTQRLDGEAGRLLVTLSKNGETRVHKVHQLIAAAWLGEHQPDQEVCHGPAGRFINSVPNLSYGTGTKNYQDQVRDGVCARGERHGRAKLTAEVVATCRRRKASGETTRALAQEFNVHPSTMSRALTGARHAWIDVPYPLAPSIPASSATVLPVACTGA
jgi:hypothetical protein